MCEDKGATKRDTTTHSISGTVISLVTVLALGVLIAFVWMTHTAESTSMDNLAAGLQADVAAQDLRTGKRLQALQDQVASLQTMAAAVFAESEDAPVSFDLALAPMVGPGITVEIDDSDAHQGTVLHDQDLLVLVNELWAADAEGIAINGQRLSTASPIRCTGPTVRVNDVALGTPFRIDAVGSPDALRSALRLPNGVVAELDLVGIEVKVDRSDRVELPSAAFRRLRWGDVSPPQPDEPGQGGHCSPTEVGPPKPL